MVWDVGRGAVWCLLRTDGLDNEWLRDAFLPPVRGDAPVGACGRRTKWRYSFIHLNAGVTRGANAFARVDGDNRRRVFVVFLHCISCHAA